MPRKNRKTTDIFDNPQSVESFFRETGQKDLAKKRSEQIEAGSHPTPEILFDYALGLLPDSEQEKCLNHIAYCIRCSTEIHSILASENRLREAEGKVKASLPYWFIILKDCISSLSIQIESYVNRSVEVLVPEPIGFTTKQLLTSSQFTRPRYKTVTQRVETKEFVSGEEINVDIQIPDQGYLATFVFSSSEPMEWVFPGQNDAHTSFPPQEIKTMSFQAPESPGPWTFKAIFSKHDPLKRVSLRSDKSWNDHALQCLADHIKDMNEDDWAAGSLEFRVKNT